MTKKSQINRRYKRRASLCIAAAVMLAATAGVSACGGDDDDDGGDSGGEPIRIGRVLSLSGAVGPYDEGVNWGAERAIEDINNDGGVDGRQLEALPVVDNKSEAPIAADQTVRLIEEENVDVLLSPCGFDFGGSTSSLEASSRGVLTVSGCGTAPIPPDASGGLHFDILPSTFSEGAAMAEWAMDQGYEQPITVQDTTALPLEQATLAFEARWEELGGGPIERLTMEYGQQSFNTQVSQITQASPEPDVIYLATFMPSAAQFLRAVRAAGIDLPVLGTEDWDGDVWKSGADVNDVQFPAVASLYGNDPVERVNELVAEYERENNELPFTSVGVAGGYMAVQAFARAIEQSDGSTDGAELTETMEGWENEELLTQPVSFNPDLHVPLVGDERIMEINNNETSFVEVLAPESVPTPTE